ncbi:MAG TPA: hypothetical protein VG672_22105, partial [Bryobacteraceae bacterium]|nr:hypothetical protein [Bryobacteraceae bacterium]
MMHALRWIWAAAWLAPIALAQGQTDVSFLLAPRNGRMSFRLGESVDVEFRLASSLPGRYRIWTTSGTRYVRISRFDKVLVEPAQTVVDPLRDIPAQFEGGVVAGVPPTPVPLTAVPMVFERHVNEWISFRQPGRYRITVETTRVETTAQPPASVTLRSNPIEIEIVAPEAGWAAAQLRQAVAMLERGDPPPPVIGQTIQGSVEQARTEEMAHAGRVLRFLETRDAMPALARFFEHGPQAAQQEIRAGLFASPYRKEVIAAMEESIAAPGTPVTYYYLATLMELAAASRMGPS